MSCSTCCKRSGEEGMKIQWRYANGKTVEINEEHHALLVDAAKLFAMVQSPDVQPEVMLVVKWMLLGVR